MVLVMVCGLERCYPGCLGCCRGIRSCVSTLLVGFFRVYSTHSSVGLFWAVSWGVFMEC